MKSIKNLFSCVFSLLLLWAGPASAEINHGTLGVADTVRVQNVLQITDNQCYDHALIEIDGYYGSPWSSDGQWIVYSTIFEELWAIEICIIRPDGTGFQQLTNGGDWVFSVNPSFTPDGAKIVFGKSSEDGESIWIMDADGSGQTSLTDAHGGDKQDEHNPSVSPDGTKVAFNTYNQDIWVMNIDGSNPLSLSQRTEIDFPEGSNLIFQPNGTGGFNVSTCSGAAFQWEGNYGTSLGLYNDEVDNQTFDTFSFPFAGETYTGGSMLSISSNGFVRLGGDNGSGWCSGNPDELVNDDYARIAPMWTDLDPSDDGYGDVYINRFNDDRDPDIDRIVVTWDTVFSGGYGPVLVQAQLFEDGNIIMGFHNLQQTCGNDILTGVSPGGGVVDPGSTDFTAQASFSSGSVPTVYKVFYTPENTNPTWSPDSRWVLFSGRSPDTGHFVVYKTKADGTSFVMPSGAEEAVNEDCAFWSLDGNLIAYRTMDWEESNPTLSIMRMDGTDKHVLVQETEDGIGWDSVSGPKSWSPDSKWIVFNKRSGEDGQESIFAVNIETEEQIRLTKDYWDNMPFWSPDNTRILFTDWWDGSSRDNGENGIDLLVLKLNPAYFPPYSPDE